MDEQLKKKLMRSVLLEPTRKLEAGYRRSGPGRMRFFLVLVILIHIMGFFATFWEIVYGF